MQRPALLRRLSHRVGRHPVLRSLRQEARDRDVPLWLVGGFVRDAAMGRPAGDFDLVSAEGTPRWLAWASERFGTQGFRFHKRKVTTWRFRFDGESVDWVDADRRGLEADLLRRDFTVNAMAYEIGGSTLADPLGGLKDLRHRRLRLCSDRALWEDPVRILRLARFAVQLGFRIDRAAEQAAIDAASKLSTSAVERTVYEFDRIFRCRKPLIALEPLYRWGLVNRLLPELRPLKECLAGSERPNVEEHTRLAIGMTATLPRRRVPFAARLTDPESRRILHWALWLHDIAKPATFATLPDGRPSFHGHEMLGGKMAERLLRRLKFGGEDRSRITRLIRLHLRPGHLADSGASPRGLRRLARDAGTDLPLLALHAAADALGSGAARGQVRWQKLRQVLHQLERTAASLQGVRRRPWLSGDEVMRSLNIDAGPEIGRILGAMVDAQESGEIGNKIQAEAWLAKLQL